MRRTLEVNRSLQSTICTNFHLANWIFYYRKAQGKNNIDNGISNKE